MIYTILIEWGKEFSLFLFIAVAFLFSFLARITIFRELDYYEIKYTQKTKQRTAMANIFQSTRCLTLAIYFTTVAFTPVATQIYLYFLEVVLHEAGFVLADK